MAVPEKCDVCGDRHHAHQAHRFASIKPVKVEVRSSRVVAVPASVDWTFNPTWVERNCVVCGVGFYTKRAHARTCSPRCRQAASRKRRRA